MTRAIFTHEHHNCGDNMLHLHLVRALAKQHQSTPFVHFCNACHHENLRAVIADLPNILLASFESDLWRERKHESIGVWKNEGNAWVDSPLRWKWADYYLWWHKVVARGMGFESPFQCREQLLFDYPALQMDDNCVNWWADFLIGDSAPSSGQYSEWADHSKQPLQPLIQALREAGRSVVLTSELKEKGYSISDIGRESVNYHHLIMIPNGPFFGTLNTTNHHYSVGRRRIILLDNGEQLGMPNIDQVKSVSDVMEIAKQEKWV